MTWNRVTPSAVSEASHAFVPVSSVRPVAHASIRLRALAHDEFRRTATTYEHAGPSVRAVLLQDLVDLARDLVLLTSRWVDMRGYDDAMIRELADTPDDTIAVLAHPDIIPNLTTVKAVLSAIRRERATPRGA